ncbi:hypothetical protein K2X92_04345 [Candidatus Gracilibacteria bacterium]|nr:hypothetical protein [Candidatus Gracilibacteria bacterium]
MKSKIILFLVALFWLAQVSANQGSISKNDACALKQDGIYHTAININNYPGYQVSVENFYKEKNMLFYVVNATSLTGNKNEAFLWSWNCKTNKPKQLSKNNFLITKDYNFYVNSLIKIEYTDKHHIFLKRTFEKGKGEEFAPIFSVFYRSNGAINPYFTIEANSIKKFQSSVLDKKIYIPCSYSRDKGCSEENGVQELLYTSKRGYDFYIENIYKENNQVYITFRYANLSTTNTGIDQYILRAKLDLSNGKILFDPN